MNEETVKYLERFPSVAQAVDFNTLEQDVIKTLPQYWVEVFGTSEFEVRKAIL